MRTFFAIILSFAFTTFVAAQDIAHVLIGVDGLHCSACSYSVEKSLKKLDFVSVIRMDLNARRAEVFFKDEAKVDFSDLAKAVERSGFSVRSLKVILKENVADGLDCWNNSICLQAIQGSSPRKLQLLGKKFLSRQESKKWPVATMSCANCNESSPLIAIAHD